MKNVEEMVAHGGMGDAKAIVHHCGEAARYAETMIKQLSASGSRRDYAVASLNEVIRQCRRVSEFGIHADPGQLLNPATKARAAAQESVKSLGLTKTKNARPSVTTGVENEDPFYLVFTFFFIGNRQPALHYVYLPVFQSLTSSSGVGWLILYCARRTSTFLSCAFREQEDDQCRSALHSLTVIFIVTGFRGLSNSSRAAVTILSTTSIPRKTSPKTV